MKTSTPSTGSERRARTATDTETYEECLVFLFCFVLGKGKLKLSHNYSTIISLIKAKNIFLGIEVIISSSRINPFIV